MNDISATLGIVISILLLTSFVKIATSLSIFRIGIGLNQSGFGVVVIAVSLALSLLAMNPQLTNLGGINGIFNGKLGKTDADYGKIFMPFLEKNSDPQILERINKFASKSVKADVTTGKDEKNKAETPVVKNDAAFEVAIVSFLLTELKEAFQIGLIILIPFLVIDLLVVNALILIGANQLNPDLVSLPLKLVLFFAIDGWTLLAEKLLRTYL